MRSSLFVVSCLVVSLIGCGGGSTVDAGPGPAVVTDGGIFASFTAPAGNQPNTFLVTVTGEGAATEGIGFPPSATGGEPYFLDGWQVTFTRVLVTVGSVHLSENPDLDPNDPSATGPRVAQVDGPWAVDLAKGGPLTSKEQNGTATALARIPFQTLKEGTPAFDATSRYAFGHELVVAKRGVYDVNLDEAGRVAYASMIDAGYSVLLEGVAEWKGDGVCRSTSTTYDFTRLAKTVRFSLGFAAPVNFLNCVNPELSPADSRGVQTTSNAQAVTQVTFHLDHPFWEALQEDAPLRWDALAARQSGVSVVDVSTSDVSSVDLQSPRDADGVAIPWRTCGPVLTDERTTGTVSYDPVNVPVNPAGGAAGLANLADYMRYNLSTFGHLNNDGLCFPSRQYPSPK